MNSGGTWSKKLASSVVIYLIISIFGCEAYLPEPLSTQHFHILCPYIFEFPPFLNKAIYSHPISTFTSKALTNPRNTIIETSTKPPIPSHSPSHTAKAQRYHLAILKPTL